MDLNSKVVIDVHQFITNNKGASYTVNEILNALNNSGRERLYSSLAVMDAVNDLTIHDYLRRIIQSTGNTRYVWKKDLEKRILKIKINFNNLKND